MAKGHRSQIKKERNEENRDTRPKAHAKYIKLSDTKARVVLEEIKGKDVRQARAILAYAPQYAALIIKKTLDSAVANAENNMGLDADELFVQEAVANRGSAHYSRFRLRARARGRAYRIERKVSHITIILNKKPAKGGK